MTISRTTPSPIVQRPVAPAPARPAAATTSSASATAARGTDSPLWNVLTDEERAFFLDLNAHGPISYGPRGAASQPPAAPLGQRLDVRA